MERIKRFFSDNICYIIVFIVGAAYILTSLFTIGRTNKTVYEIIADGALTYLVSTCVLVLMRNQGILNGARDERVNDTETNLGEVVIRLNPYLDILDEWCIKTNDEDLKARRTKILSRGCLKYDDWFDADGTPKEFDIEKPKGALALHSWHIKKKAYDDARKCKIKQLVSTTLTTVSSKETDPHDFGRDKGQYQTRENTKAILKKALTVFVFAYFSVSMLNFSWSNIIWKLFQFTFFILMGVIQLFNSYTYMTDEYRGGIVKKLRYLQKFENYLKENNLMKEE